MIVKIETEIKGNFVIEKDMIVKHHPFEFDIRYDKLLDNFFISISRKIIDYNKHIPILESRNNKATEIRFPSEEFLSEQIEILQHLESLGAIDKEVSKIDWQNCSIEWIPELPEEDSILPIRKYYRDIEYESKKNILSKDWLFNTIIHRRQCAQLTLPFSFFREGVNFYHNFQYQNAFINFYFMLEGFFGNGVNFKNKIMKFEFSKSEILEYGISESIKHLEKKNDHHHEWLLETCKENNKNIDKKGIIHLLVEMRGKLSHFSFKKSNRQKNYFNDNEYSSLAFFTMMICKYSIVKLRFEPLKKTFSR